MPELSRRVITVAPLPPEKAAYALARYSRSADSIQNSLEWVRTHDSSKFLESFYFQYGHASIADLGHLVLCFEGISELAATEIEDEQLWDGQARSSRYQDFGRSGFILPTDFDADSTARYVATGNMLLDAYRTIQARMVEYLRANLPRPESLKADTYERNIAARAFDVSRYCLFFGIPTGVGQVVSIRTLERQIRRMRASEYAELRQLGEETALACSEPPLCGLPGYPEEPLAPTLARHVEADLQARKANERLELWASQNLPEISDTRCDVAVTIPVDRVAEIAATLLYPVSTCSFSFLYELMLDVGERTCMEVIDVAHASRTPRDELFRNFRTSTYAFDIEMDAGAYRDLHRHRRCQQFRQKYTTRMGFAIPDAIVSAGLVETFSTAIEAAHLVFGQLRGSGAEYILPFATRSRFLFKMDFAEAEYIIRLRSGVKGHFSYRQIAWRMKEELEKAEPALAKILHATPPWVEDPLTR